MAVTNGDIFRMTISGMNGNKPVKQVSHWRVNNATAVDTAWTTLAESMWRHFREEVRAFPTTAYTELFQTVRLDTVNKPIGEFGEFGIPLTERSGTRAAGTASEKLANFLCAPIKLLVGTKATKSGSKRLAGLVEGDVNANNIVPALFEHLADIGAKYSTEADLGAPTIGVRCQPVIFRDGKGVGPSISQDVTGFAIPLSLTTQKTRQVRQ